MWTHTFREVVVATAQVHGMDTPSEKVVVPTAQVHGVDTHLQGSGSCYSIAAWCGHTFREVVVLTAKVHGVDTHL